MTCPNVCRRSIRIVLVAMAGLVATPALDAQTGPQAPRVLSSVELLLRVGDDARRDLRPADALQSFQSILEVDPRHYGALWRAARESLSVGTAAESDDEKKRYFAEAEQYSRRALEVDPEGADASLWLAVALGKRATKEGPRTKVALTVDIRNQALRTLELDSLNAGAHHVLGEWHAEIRRLSGVTRWAARKFLGAGVFDEASWEDAEHHLRRAVELEPESGSHHLALGRLYLDRDRTEEGLGHIRRVLELPVRQPEDVLDRQEAERVLAAF